MGDGTLEYVCSFPPLISIDSEGYQRSQISGLYSPPARTGRGPDEHEDNEDEAGGVAKANHGNGIEPRCSTGDRLEIGDENLLAHGKIQEAAISFDEEYEDGTQNDKRRRGCKHNLCMKGNPKG